MRDAKNDAIQAISIHMHDFLQCLCVAQAIRVCVCNGEYFTISQWEIWYVCVCDIKAFNQPPV